MRFLFLFAALIGIATGVFAQPRKAPAGRKPAPPHLVFERLNRMSPEQRDRMLSKLPPERKATVEQRLERYNNLPPEAKKRLRDEYDQFQKLAPEKQDAVRKMFREFSELPPDRRPQVRRELNRLRRMSAEDRQARLSSEEFRSNFDANERHLLETLSDALVP